MKILRFTALAVSLLLTALSTRVLLLLSLEGFFPAWMVAKMPWLAGFARFLPEDLLVAGQWTAVLACLLFGVSVPTLRSSIRRQIVSTPSQASALPFAVLTAMVFAAALILVLGPLLPLPGWLTFVIWLAGIVVVFLLAETLERERQTRVLSESGAAPERGWPWLLVILGLAAFLYSWRNGLMPLAFPAESEAALGQALAVADMLAQGPLAHGSAGVPYIATFWAAFGQVLPINPLLGLAVSALAWGLATVTLTWLVACELLREPFQGDGQAGGGLESADGGSASVGHTRSTALLAAMVVAVSLAAIQYARIPLGLEVVVWGSAGIWALLRAVRTGSYRLAAAGGVALGVGAVWQPAGILFVILAAITWLGFLLWRMRWLASDLGGFGVRGAVLWLAAVAVAAAPAICGGGCLLLPAWMGDAQATWSGLANVLAAVGVPAAGAPAAAHGLTLAGVIVAPLLLLAVGALIFHIDQMSGWVLLAWLGLGIAAATPFSAQGPAWSVLLVLLPATGVAAAFALDRLRAALASILGEWSMAATTTLAAGMLLVAALFAWRDYPALAGVRASDSSDAAAAVARWVARHERVMDFTVVSNGATRDLWKEPLVAFAVKGKELTLRSADLADPSTWPGELAAGAQVLVLPGSEEAGERMGMLLGDATLQTWRDVRGNRLLDVYVVQGEGAETAR